MSSQRHTKIECETCNKLISKNNIAIHRERHNLKNSSLYERNGNKQPFFQKVVKVNDYSDDEQDELLKTNDEIEQNDYIYKINNEQDELLKTNDEIEQNDYIYKINDEQDELLKVIRPVTEDYFINKSGLNKPKTNYIIKNMGIRPDVQTINNVNALNKKLTDVINNFNGHIKKIYIEKANQSDVNNLKNQIDYMSSDIEAIRRTLTEQSRGIYRVSKEYNNGKSKKRKRIINGVIKNTSIGGGKNTKIYTNNVLNNLKHIVDANKNSLNKVFSFIESVKDDINIVKAKQEALDTRMTCIDNTNNILQKDVNILKKIKHLTEEDIIKIVKNILLKEGKKINTKEIVDIINEPKNIANNMHSQELIEPETLKEISPYRNFNEEMNDIVNKMRLTKNNELNKTTIKCMKKIIEKHDKMGHLQEIKKFMEDLPINKTKNNKKKVIVKKHLNTVIKNLLIR